MKFIQVLLYALLVSLLQAEEVVEENVTQEQYEQMLVEFENSLNKQEGSITLSGGLVELEIPEGYYFLDAEDSKKVLEELWGNPPSSSEVQGMIFPSSYSITNDAVWGVTVEYSDEGHVKDKDASKIDYEDLLADMQSDTLAASKARVEMGYEAIELVGWASEPYYDETSKKLHWAKNIRFGTAEENTLNYNIRVLGREGYLLMNFIANMSQLEEINEVRDDVLAMAHFTEGNTYADFDPKLDNVAAYGIGGLVAGKVLAKTGILAKILLATKKIWIVLVVAVGSFIKRALGRSDK